MHALAPNTLVAPLTKTIGAFCHLNLLVEVDLLFFVNDFHPKTNFILDIKREIDLIFVVAHSPHLLFGGPLGMVYEIL
jgi:hypothetical protein